MDPNTRLLLVGARYANHDDAVQDYENLWNNRHKGKYDHLSVAVLTKDDSGQLQIERHDSTTKHAAWGGAVLGAALVIVAPPAGIAAVAAGGAAMAGIGGVVGHLWRRIPKEEVQEVSALLEAGQSGLLAVVANWEPAEVPPLLPRAQRHTVVATTVGNLDEAFDAAVRSAREAAPA